MSIRFVACQSFAGGFDLGTRQAGFELVHKVEQKGGFGLANVDRNRHLMGYDWTSQVCEPAGWEPKHAELVIGNPPCSGFSPLSPKDFRGSTSPVNACMHVFADYAAKCMPHIAVFESVQQAFSGGRDLMQFLRAKMEAHTGQQWHLYHIKHNAASVGGCAIRRRYFWLVSRVPFGIEPPVVHRVPRLRDAIGDLDDLADTWVAQPYRQPASWWAKPLRNDLAFVDGHHIDWTPYTRRGMDLLGDGIEWGERENMATVAKRYYDKHGALPDSWAGSAEKVVSGGFNLGYNQLVRWRANGLARVITGGALSLVLHPWLDRPITHRETARIQGFPDDWNIYPLRNVGGLRMTWGKGIPVQCGRWVSEWCYRAITGTPGEYEGEVIGERENLIDCTHSYRSASAEV